MKSTVIGLGSAAAMAIIAAAGQPALAADGAPSNAQLLQLIQQQQKAIEELKTALSKAQKTSEQAAMKAEEAATVKEEERKAAWWKRVTVGGLIEVEASQTGTFAKKDSSDIALAKVELFVDANPFKYVNTHVQFLFEDGNNNITLDEAFVTLGDTEEFPAYLQAGEFVLSGGDGAIRRADMATGRIDLLALPNPAHRWDNHLEPAATAA
jgi:hypothetical protein